jgi:FtsP/CotA-like multicopper oxidase with cupredoxin domain
MQSTNMKHGDAPGQTVRVTPPTIMIGANTDLANLPRALPTELVELQHGDSYTITASIVKTTINGVEHKMYAYNQMIPGVALNVKQNSTVKITVVNQIDQDTTIHWHGLRHNISDDGVPGVSQPPIKPGESFTYKLYFPDAGIYWYHPHIREDIQQDAGLAGNIFVKPTDESLYPKADQEELLMLDDILIQKDQIVPYGKDHANYAIMGRFGNVLLTNGVTNYQLQATTNQVTRLYITNVANVRPFNVSIPGAKVKLVGSDLSPYQKSTFVESVAISPGERYIIDVMFDNAGEYQIRNINPLQQYTIGTIIVTTNNNPTVAASEFMQQHNFDIGIDASKYLNAQPNYTLHLTINMPSMNMGEMHMEVSEIEWEDTMQMMNARFDSSQTFWQIKDQASGKINMNVTMRAQVGDKLKVRIINDKDSMHPMQHPFHLHGQRFIVLSDNGVPNTNLVWKDTVLIPVGHTMDILIDVTNPGEWMAHCHIAEHLESGMMISLIVEDNIQSNISTTQSSKKTMGMH